MTTDLIILEHKLERIKRLLDAEVMIDVLTELLISKGITTADEITSAVTKMKSSEKYSFDVHEAEIDIEVFRFMMREGATEAARLNGFLNEDGTWKKF